MPLICKDIYVTWRQKLGAQIRDARNKAGLSQQQLAEKTSVKREHISNIELGKNSPAVKIVTDIAKALDQAFDVDGCRIEPTFNEVPVSGPAAIAQQMSLEFGVEHHFTATSLTVTSMDDEVLEMRAVFSRVRSA